MPPSRPTRRRSDPNAGPTIVDERSPDTSSSTTTAKRRKLPPAEGRTVRVTVDLPSTDRRGLGRVADLLGDELDVHVPIGQVMAALAHLVADDDQTQLRNAVSEYLRNRVVQ